MEEREKTPCALCFIYVPGVSSITDSNTVKLWTQMGPAYTPYPSGY